MDSRRRWASWIVGLALTAGLTGCLEEQPSLHALFLDSETLALPEIAGDWVSSDGDLRLRFEAEEDGRYRLLLVGSGDAESAEFDIRFGRLADALFWDLTARPWKDGPPLGTWPVHSFARVRLSDGRLEISLLDPEWLQETVETGRVSVAREIAEGKLVLTASTADLQELVSNCVFEEEAFQDPLVFLRSDAASSTGAGS